MAVSDINTTHFLYRITPVRLHAYISLGRMDRAIGYILLFYPCIWGLMLSWNVALRLPDVSPVPISSIVTYGLLFFIGAFVMRAGGCAWNDIQDRHFDAQVARTKNRPLPSGHLQVWQASIFIVIMGLIGGAVIIHFPLPAIIAGLVACVPAVLYPFFKRITHFPQVWLGVTFNWGIWVGWFTLLPPEYALRFTLIWLPLLVHILGLLWTLAYDTVYAHQDRRDDVIAGVKSSAIAFGKRTYKMAILCYVTIIMGIWYIVSILNGHIVAYISIIFMAVCVIIWMRDLQIDSPDSCKKFFRRNRHMGALISLIFALCTLQNFLSV